MDFLVTPEATTPVVASPGAAALLPPPLDPVRQALVTFANVALSDRKRAQQELEESRAFLHSIYTNIDLAIFVIDATEEGDFRYLEVNPAYEKLTGIPAVELRGLRPRDLVPMISPETATRIRGNYRRCAAVQMPMEYEELITYRGRPLWWLTRLTPQFAPNGSTARLIGTVIDITSRKTIELRLQSTTERLQLATESAQIGIWDYDPIADRLVWDEQMFWLYGITREGFGGNLAAWRGCLHPDEVAHAEKEFQTAVNETGSFDTTFRIVRPDGSERELRVRAQVQRDQEGRAIRIVGVNWDVTAERRARADILFAKEQAEHYNRQLQEALNRAQMLAQEAAAATVAKSEFLANMSHEIRTPLNAVIGMSGLLLGTQLNNEQREFAETIRSSGDSLLGLINDILDYSKIESGRLELERHPFDLRDCVESALDVLAARASEKKLDIVYWIDTDAPTAIVGDLTRLRQVIVNLLGNAVKFTSQGEVFLSVGVVKGETAKPRAEIAEPDNADGARPPFPLAPSSDSEAEASVRLHFAVRDSGIGIPADRMDRLFKTFSQVDASTTRHYGGTGLGLAICKRLVDLMGGRIWAESSAGQGSTFHFEVVVPPSPAQPKSFQRGPVPALAGKRALIVDDNATNRRILALQLEGWGLASKSTASAADALAVLDAGEKFDVAVLDMQMPAMDGCQLAAEIRKRSDTANLRLVLLTSLGHMRPAAELGIATCVTKPVKPQALFDLLVETVHGAGAKRPPVVDAGAVGEKIGEVHPLKILLAEDNLVNQRVALLMLQRLGYRADVANNGLEALEALAREHYDLLLSDVQMPEMDGLQCAQEICARWPADRPRIVAMTANASTSDREQCFAAGMDDFVSKPVRLQDLRSALLATPIRVRA